ncbi:Phosphoserine phosphatase 1 [Rosistilla ulvae]|uniref:Phosphoserine phosphatase 1 n=1 Tax=Rosistilla ulvae TaxID=1930277 RepID=A0A517M6F9_9BACT|nr:histidine phosphatase family protein [Rosistilla ulvae]QDS90437.1 Phosphoserine phosphatase 1 [Rosistilla ulvae]
MLSILLVRPGATDFDDQRRIKGSLDMPLSECGRQQVRRTAQDVATFQLQAVYSAPCESALTTSAELIAGRDIRVKAIPNFRNIDHGLWHGKLVDDVRRQQPRLYRQGEEYPNLICPPEGETVEEAKQRVFKALRKVIKKHRDGAIALVIPDPLASVVHCILSGEGPKSLWSSEVDTGNWELIELESLELREPALV